ncbi:type II secretion system protein GspM [Thalassomonas sp. M1454]|uniref:type II secretion system protein GspM n=1 Tax=Thalassomonas sp. M1454 TaxID=2594477 RepID=UPI00117D85C3|nr:type II secretion system protein M [Thalassomonas sp. M1454]TRX57892.1 type II secretion system protein M [Thalassomonas sp. M1454]
MKQWWLEQNTKDQRLMIFLGVVVAIFLFYTLIWQPLNENLVKAQSKLTKQQELAIWVKQNTAQYLELKKRGGSKKSTGSLTSKVNRTARGLGITVARMQPQGDDLLVWIDEVPFNSLLTWLEKISTQEGMRIIAVDIAPSDAEGTVKVRRLQLGNS